MKDIYVGLFGTCGNSTWRDTLFIPRYLAEGINFFNPQVKDWKPELAEIEAKHLAEDQIICFPVTAETYGTGSLAETGFSLLQAMKFDDRREIILLIDRVPDPSLDVDDPTKNLSRVAYKESTRARALVIQHLKKINLPNVRLVDSLEDMLKWTIFLYNQKKAIIDFEISLKAKPEPKPEPIVVKEPTLEDLAQISTGMTVVDFWAPWCGPCKMLSPIVEKLFGELGQTHGIKFLKVNTDDHPSIAATYSIRSIPSLLFFQNGNIKDIMIGAFPREKILEKTKTAFGLE